MLRNDLEAAALQLSSELMDLARVVRRIGRSNQTRHVAMSGSGTSFFMLFEDAAHEGRAEKELRDAGIEGKRCRFLSRRAYESRFEIEWA